MSEAILRVTRIDEEYETVDWEVVASRGLGKLWEVLDDEEVARLGLATYEDDTEENEVDLSDVTIDGIEYKYLEDGWCSEGDQSELTADHVVERIGEELADEGRFGKVHIDDLFHFALDYSGDGYWDVVANRTLSAVFATEGEAL